VLPSWSVALLAFQSVPQSTTVATDHLAVASAEDGTLRDGEEREEKDLDAVLKTPHSSHLIAAQGPLELGNELASFVEGLAR
jgi:hypothetical protein